MSGGRYNTKAIIEDSIIRLERKVIGSVQVSRRKGVMLLFRLQVEEPYAILHLKADPAKPWRPWRVDIGEVTTFFTKFANAQDYALWKFEREVIK